MVVRGGRIEVVGARASTAIPRGMRVLDVKGATIVPGLWDMHAHAAQIEWLPAYLASTAVHETGQQHARTKAVALVVGRGGIQVMVTR